MGDLNFIGVSTVRVALLLIGFFWVLAGTPTLASGLPVEKRADIALDLSKTISACIVKNDTRHPVFHGCIDWHSSVHGAWALTAYTRSTGDDRYRSLLEDYVAKDKLAAEQDDLTSFPTFEMPYGRAWFLLLAMEYDQTIDDRLIEIADEVAASLVAYYTSRAPRPLQGSYNNPSWALVNLLRYARYRDRKDWVDFVRLQVKQHYLTGKCEIKEEGPGFMAVCLNWAWLVAEVTPAADFAPWLQTFLGDTLDDLTPIKRPRTDHEFGMNFSRCWGLWHLFEATGDERYRVLYHEHFNASYQQRNHWDGDYRRVAHWVAQFGMYALLAPGGDSGAHERLPRNSIKER